MTEPEPPPFELGALAATPGAARATTTAGVRLVDLALRHLSGDWGDLTEDDKAANDRALVDGGRLLSAYRLDSGDDIWILTEADRATTTILLTGEY
jgi:hypothetical protein